MALDYQVTLVDIEEVTKSTIQRNFRVGGVLYDGG